MSGGNWKEMYHAARDGDFQLVSYHLQMGVDPNYAHPEFLSVPVVAAIFAGHQDVAQLLVDRGADPDLMSDLDGVTARQAAAQVGMPLTMPSVA